MSRTRPFRSVKRTVRILSPTRPRAMPAWFRPAVAEIGQNHARRVGKRRDLFMKADAVPGEVAGFLGFIPFKMFAKNHERSVGRNSGDGLERAIAAIAAAVHLRLRRRAPEQQHKGGNGSGNDSRQIHGKPLFVVQASAFGTVGLKPNRPVSARRILVV